MSNVLQNIYPSISTNISPMLTAQVQLVLVVVMIYGGELSVPQHHVVESMGAESSDVLSAQMEVESRHALSAHVVESMGWEEYNAIFFLPQDLFFRETLGLHSPSFHSEIHGIIIWW